MSTNDRWRADGDILYYGDEPDEWVRIVDAPAYATRLAERHNAVAAHAAAQQASAIERIGALTAHLKDLLVWTGVLLGTAPDSEPDPSARNLVLASRRAAKQRLDAADDAGVPLLTELRAARAVLTVLIDWMRTGRVCPICGSFSAPSIASFQHADSCVLGAYEKVMRGATDER